ncbi:ABC transporter substrate-binding protein (plasmid) [Rhizobium bangladeshense]|uniref:ABC transporter substrate-binding protein n=1 Tax=Rhizobium bangladeshense TaxID=1138189 RepID=UPI001A98AC65|nr:ABC transporter substrate-binding protein [Rhizobium bangladeshense]QSY98000.1 ABC transporter substrate-binding protein [Rhizobium bangladeshense]
MYRRSILMAAMVSTVALALTAGSASANDKLVVSTWGGSFRDLIDEAIGQKFTAETGVEVEYVTGGTMDRLNQAKLASAKPESDITFTTAHVGWLYANDGLFEQLDLSKMPNASHLVEQAKISPYHIGAWAYVYTIGYLPDQLPKGVKFDSWEGLWDPALKGMIASPDFDPSHIIAVAAKLEGGDAAHWEKGQEKLKALKPNYKAFYTNDANSQQLFATGETPVQVILSMNAYYMRDQGVPVELVIPKEGGVLGVDTMGIMKGSTKSDLAYKFMNIALDPEVQAKIAELKKGSPVIDNAKLKPEIAALPGIFTTPEQWASQTLIIDHKLRAEKTAEWRKWFAENMIGK